MRTFTWPVPEIKKGFWHYAYPVAIVLIIICLLTGIFTFIKKREAIEEEHFEKVQNEKDIIERTELTPNSIEV